MSYPHIAKKNKKTFGLLLEFSWFLIGLSLVDKLKYQHWRNDINTNVGIFIKSPNTGKLIMFYQPWYIDSIFQHWDMCKLVGNYWNFRCGFINLGVLKYFRNIGKHSYQLVNW